MLINFRDLSFAVLVDLVFILKHELRKKWFTNIYIKWGDCAPFVRWRIYTGFAIAWLACFVTNALYSIERGTNNKNDNFH